MKNILILNVDLLCCTLNRVLSSFECEKYTSNTPKCIKYFFSINHTHLLKLHSFFIGFVKTSTKIIKNHNRIIRYRHNYLQTLVHYLVFTHHQKNCNSTNVFLCRNCPSSVLMGESINLLTIYCQNFNEISLRFCFFFFVSLINVEIITKMWFTFGFTNLIEIIPWKGHGWHFNLLEAAFVSDENNLEFSKNQMHQKYKQFIRI